MVATEEPDRQSAPRLALRADTAQLPVLTGSDGRYVLDPGAGR